MSLSFWTLIFCWRVHVTRDGSSIFTIYPPSWVEETREHGLNPDGHKEKVRLTPEMALCRNLPFWYTVHVSTISWFSEHVFWSLWVSLRLDPNWNVHDFTSPPEGSTLTLHLHPISIQSCLVRRSEFQKCERSKSQTNRSEFDSLNWFNFI